MSLLFFFLYWDTLEKQLNYFSRPLTEEKTDIPCDIVGRWRVYQRDSAFTGKILNSHLLITALWWGRDSTVPRGSEKQAKARPCFYCHSVLPSKGILAVYHFENTPAFPKCSSLLLGVNLKSLSRQRRSWSWQVLPVPNLAVTQHFPL